MAKKLKITQIKSTIGGKPQHRETIRTLGLKRLHHSVICEDRPEVRGMVNAVRHLVKCEEVD